MSWSNLLRQLFLRLSSQQYGSSEKISWSVGSREIYVVSEKNHIVFPYYFFRYFLFHFIYFYIYVFLFHFVFISLCFSVIPISMRYRCIYIFLITITYFILQGPWDLQWTTEWLKRWRTKNLTPWKSAERVWSSMSIWKQQAKATIPSALSVALSETPLNAAVAVRSRQ